MKDEITGLNKPGGGPQSEERLQAAVASLDQRALAGVDLSTLMNEAVALVAETLDVRYCNVLEPIGGSTTFRMRAGTGWQNGRPARATVDGGPTSQAGCTLAYGQAVVVQDFRWEQKFKVPAVVHDEPVASGISVVIPGHDQPFGVLGVAATTPRKFGADAVKFMEAVAGVLAAAVERQRTQRVHKTAEETDHTLRALIHASPLAIISLDPGGRVRSWNPTAERIFGWSEDEVLGHSDPILYQVHLEELGDLQARVLRGDTLTEVAARVLQKDGRPVDVTISTAPMYDGDGAINGIIAVIADVTERRRTEAAQAQLMEIVETTTDFVAITDVPGRGFYINKAGRRMLGIGPDEDISSVNIADIYTEEARSFILNEAMPGAIVDGGWSGETAFMSLDGREIPVSQVLIAHKADDGTVQFFSTIARDMTERKLFEAQLVQLANNDPLTGLYNRRRFEEEMERALAQSRRFNARGALMFLDLDQFKDVNDSLGHPAGDQLLLRMAGLLRERLRATDVIARTGGDEFAVLLPHTDVAEAESLAGDLLEAMRGTTITAGGRQIGITASIGIIIFPDHGTTVSDLLARADLAMYQAKENGRNRYGVFTPDRDWQGESESRLAWQRRIREALAKDLFVLQAQPILDLRTNTVSHYELLLRMIGEKKEVIPPGAFLETAERFGLIHAIDRWVVRQTIHLIAHNRRAGREVSLVTNVSGKAFADTELVPMIQRELAATSINPANLVLEITEAAAITSLFQVERFVNTLRTMGCRVGLDDFGLGFASFYHLKRLPVDYLKIDGSLIKDLPRDTVDQQMVKALVTLAHGLGKETIAEHVSDAETMRLLREYKVDYAQGFHVGTDGPKIVSP